MGPYKPLRTWVDEFIPYYMETSWELIDPIAHVKKKAVRLPKICRIGVSGFSGHQPLIPWPAHPQTTRGCNNFILERLQHRKLRSCC